LRCAGDRVGPRNRPAQPEPVEGLSFFLRRGACRRRKTRQAFDHLRLSGKPIAEPLIFLLGTAAAMSPACASTAPFSPSGIRPKGSANFSPQGARTFLTFQLPRPNLPQR
jgi:hypothetical protein